MEQVNIHAAKTHLSSLVERAASGEPFIIAKAGKPLVKVIPYGAEEECPRIGFLKGRISVPDNFDRAGESEISEMYEGGL